MQKLNLVFQKKCKINKKANEFFQLAPLLIAFIDRHQSVKSFFNNFPLLLNINTLLLTSVFSTCSLYLTTLSGRSILRASFIVQSPYLLFLNPSITSAGIDSTWIRKSVPCHFPLLLNLASLFTLSIRKVAEKFERLSLHSTLTAFGYLSLNASVTEAGILRTCA